MKSNKAQRLFVGLIVGISLNTISQATHAVSTPSADRQVVHPGEILHIPIIGQTHDLLFELDGIDVTALVQINGNQASLIPLENLSIGKHQLTVYRLVGEDLQNLASLAYHVESISSNTALASTETSTTVNNIGDNNASTNAVLSNISIHGNINASRVLAQSGSSFTGNDQNWQLDGNANIEGQWGRDDWLVNANTNLFLSSTENTVDNVVASSNQQGIDMSDFLISLKKGNLSGKIGHHQIQSRSDSLLLRNFHRRGISANWLTSNNHLGFTSFAFSHQPITGFKGGLGISDRENRIAGSILKYKPFSVANDATEIVMTWLTGNSLDSSGANSTASSILKSGKAWSLAANSQFLKSKLEIKGEVAQSIFDEDGVGGDNSVNDNAYTVGAVYKALTPDYSNKHHSSLEFGLDHRHVGTFFRSLANSGLSYDLDSTKIHSLFNNKGFTLQSSLEEQKNNSNNLENIPTLKTTQALLTANYTPSYGNSKPPKFLGRPSFGATFSQTKQKTISQPESFTTEIDQGTLQSTLYANFSHKKWGWNVSLSQNEIEDNSTSDNSSQNKLLGLGFNLRPNQRFNISSQWQFGTQENQNSDNTTQQLLSLNANAELIPQKLNLTSSLSWNEQRTEHQLQSRTSSLNLGLNWTPDATKTKKAHMTYWLKGQYIHQESDISDISNANSYQALAGLSVNF